MRKLNGKLFVYEMKKLLLLPAIFFAAYLVLCVIQMFGLEPQSLLDIDMLHEQLLYVFYVLLVLSFTYRTFADRKSYEKVRVSPEKLFLIRLAVIAIACVAYTVSAVLLGTARVAIVKHNFYEEYMRSDNVYLFAYQRKEWWYFLFGFSVAMTACITYSFVVYVSNVLYSNERWFMKTFGIVVLASAVLAMHVPIQYCFNAPTLGGKELFGFSLPVASVSYAEYAHYRSYGYTWLYETLTSGSPKVLLCHVAWNISNLATLLVGILFIAFVFLSITFFSRKQNDGYLYVSKEENKK